MAPVRMQLPLRAASRTQEGMSNQNRVQPGVPSSGEFEAHSFPEATGVTLVEPAARP